MSIVEKALVKSRSVRGREPDALAQPLPAPASEPAPRPTPARSVAMQAGGNDALRVFWSGHVDASLVNHLRGLRRELLAHLQPVLDSGGVPLVLITSPLPGDGKTFVSAAISRTFARAPDMPVTLVDLDLVRHSCSNLFGAEDLPGLLDCIQGGTAVQDVLCATDVPRLTMVPAGIGSGERREAFVGDGLIAQLEQLRRSNPGGIVFLDAPPVLPVVETSLLASKVDLVLLVVRAGQTPQAAVLDSLARLGPQAKVCIALNSVVHAHTSEYYDYSTYGATDRRSSDQ